MVVRQKTVCAVQFGLTSDVGVSVLVWLERRGGGADFSEVADPMILPRTCPSSCVFGGKVERACSGVIQVNIVDQSFCYTMGTSVRRACCALESD